MDGGKLVGAIAVAAVIAAGPLWVATVRGAKTEALAAPLGTGACIEPRVSMRTSHPGLLSAWREQVVREGRRTYHTTDGRDVPIGLAETCLGCHGEASKFCDRCHAQHAVTVSCWQCHPQAPGARP